MRLPWLWPTIIILSAAAAFLVTFLIPGTPLRPLIVMWFLFVCPGMMVVRFLRLNEPVSEWTIALALSFSIDAIVAGIMLYAGKWSPTGTLIILLCFSCGGALLQCALLLTRTGTHVAVGNSTSSVANPPHPLTQADHWQKHDMLPLGLHSTHSPHSTPPWATPQIDQVSFLPTNPALASTAAAVLTSSYPKVAKIYSGAIKDVPTGKTTNISLTGIQQEQEGIKGGFTKLFADTLSTKIPNNGSFKGSVHITNQLQFTVTDKKGQVAVSFDGFIQPNGNIEGTYSVLEANGKESSRYGYWRVSPQST